MIMEISSGVGAIIFFVDPTEFYKNIFYDICVKINNWDRNGYPECDF